MSLVIGCIGIVLGTLLALFNGVALLGARTNLRIIAKNRSDSVEHESRACVDEVASRLRAQASVHLRMLIVAVAIASVSAALALGYLDGVTGLAGGVLIVIGIGAGCQALDSEDCETALLEGGYQDGSGRIARVVCFVMSIMTLAVAAWLIM